MKSMGEVDRLERLLAVLLLQNMKDASQEEKATQLSVAGFTNVEIADLLDTTANTVAVALSRSRGKRTERRVRAKANSHGER